MPGEAAESKASGPGAADCCAIIPAYNEAGRVSAMVRLAVDSALFSEVLVVDDGSSDATAAEAQAAGARLLRHEKNMGKARAMQSGLGATQAPLVCYLDADLLNVSPQHLSLLVEPVRNGTADATLGVFEGGRLLTGMAQKIAPMISGQRCLRRELLAGFDDWGCGYGIETSLNAYLLSIGVKQQIVYWKGAAQVMKEEKWGLWRGLRTRAKMMFQVVRSWFASKFR